MVVRKTGKGMLGIPLGLEMGLDQGILGQPLHWAKVLLSGVSAVGEDDLGFVFFYSLDAHK